ncbi:MAG: ABC transporter permease [Rhodospirillaceae bacterium]|nr:ABC transporter permease [Rhodospirillaceae bacterium]
MDFGRLELRLGAAGNLVPAGAALAALALCAAFLAVAGYNPARAAVVLIEGSLGTWDGLYEVLTRSVPMAIVGLGITVAFRANVYNIGADGQVILGGIVGVIALQAAGDLGIASVPWLLLFAVIGGAAYGGLAGWLRARFDANEIIVTIMLNYVAAQLLGWVVRGPLQEDAAVFPRSNTLFDSAALPELIPGSLHSGVLIAVVVAVIVHLVLRRSVFGYQIDAVGENREAAEYGGIDARRIIVLSMVVSGGLCGLAGGIEVSGVFHRLEETVAPGIGMAGIAVALMARLNALAVPLTALVFGILTVGAGALQRQMGVPFPVLWIIEAAVIFAFLLAGWRSGSRAAQA